MAVVGGENLPGRLPHRGCSRLGTVGALLLLRMVGLEAVSLCSQGLDKLVELDRALFRLSQPPLEELAVRVRDCVLALELLDTETLLARRARVVLADVGLALNLGCEASVGAAQAIDFAQKIPVGLLTRVTGIGQ